MPVTTYLYNEFELRRANGSKFLTDVLALYGSDRQTPISAGDIYVSLNPQYQDIGDLIEYYTNTKFLINPGTDPTMFIMSDKGYEAIAYWQNEEAKEAALQAKLDREQQRQNNPGRAVIYPLPYGPYDSQTAALLGGLLYGGEVVGYENLTVTNTEAKRLTLPTEARYAILICEADTAATLPEKAVRYKQDKTTLATPTNGMILGDLGTLEIGTIRNLKNFSVIGIRAGESHKITVEYYG